MQGFVKTCLVLRAGDLTEVYSPALFNERSRQLGLSAAVAAALETGWNLRSSELRTAQPKMLIATPPCPLFLKLKNTTIGKINPAGECRSTVITTGSHLIFAMRECFEQMHRGDHFIFEHPSNASFWNELCVQKLVAKPSVARIEGPMCRTHVSLASAVRRIRIHGRTCNVVDESSTLGTGARAVA